MLLNKLFIHLLLLQEDVTGPKDREGEIDVNPTSIIEKLDKWLDSFIKALPNILIGIAVLIAFIYISRWLGRLVKRLLKNKGRANFGDLLGAFTRYLVMIGGIAIALTIMAPNLSPADLIAGMGVSSVAIGFAFQDILQNWLAGILILLRQPFEIGDQIIVNNYEGTVEKIKTRATIIKTYDGQRVVIPNNTVYNTSVVVKTAHEYIRSQYDVGLGYDENYMEAMKILKETIEKVEGVTSEKPVETLVWDQADSWLTIRVRWWTKSDRASVVHVWSKVLHDTQKAMDDAGIDLPFPTQVEIQNAHDLKEAREDLENKVTTHKKTKSKKAQEAEDTSNSEEK
ncbi:mechanosensitive ion channel family protein [Marinirhabdus gelatinilytica]|uniref:Mechanosensitive ion channel-like protein n=1 Tax=Marinirhabdus gelatinilytica TaxID=1703343 RepID=A0A370QFH0_9FLAO|nr:mechanosensitive ion channel family protein [Marinirhabdus gelatinilytica]RDK87111.1 mechanosensitive ion channel-like protein [Marinirhabdus gelatinilytica]